MTIKVVIIVYNRLANVERWLHCWKSCNQTNAELIVIHNTDSDQPEYRQLVESNGCTYIARPNRGFDIGAFQDICLNRLPGFPDWNRILWCTDDTWPMQKDFVQVFSRAMKPGVGVACMQLSPAVRRHIRTTGFMIDKSTAIKLIWPFNPITTKEDCYQFEHRHPAHTFYDQVKKIGLKVIQVADNVRSPLWDTEYRKRLNRKAEHFKVFKQKPMAESVRAGDGIVTFICPIYQGYPQIISSLLMQTNPNWRLLLIHDGPGNIEPIPNDERITVTYTEARRGNWGHSYRAEYLQKVESEFLAITNNDNYHAPVYVEYLLKAFRPGIVGAYCSDMVHSYNGWQVIPCRLERGYIDCAGMLLRTKEAQAVGWNDIVSHSADWFFFADLIKRYGPDRFVKVKGCLLVHN